MGGGFARVVFYPSEKQKGTNCGSWDGPTDPGHCHCPAETDGPPPLPVAR